MPSKPKAEVATPAASKRYFAQVGSELIEIPAEEVALHADGARLSTSSEIAHYRVRATVADAGGSSSTYEGIGDTWKAADAALEAQIPKAVKS